MATPNHNFGAGNANVELQNPPLPEGSGPAGKPESMLSTNQKFIGALLASLRKTCEDNLDFHTCIKISGSILFNIDGAHLDVLQVNEVIIKSLLPALPLQPETEVKPVYKETSTDGAPCAVLSVTSPSNDTLSLEVKPPGRLPFMSEFPSEDVIRPRIDAAVQTDISHFEPGGDTTKACIFLGDSRRTDVVPPSTYDVMGNSYDQLHTEIPPAPMHAVATQQKLVGANRRKLGRTRKIQKVSEVTEAKPSRESTWPNESGQFSDEDTKEGLLEELEKLKAAPPPVSSDEDDVGRVEDAVSEPGTAGEESQGSDNGDGDDDDPDFSPNVEISEDDSDSKPRKAKSLRSASRRKRLRDSGETSASEDDEEQEEKEDTNISKKETKPKLMLKLQVPKKRKRGRPRKAPKVKKGPKKYTCPDCSFITTAAKKLRVHQKAVHANGGLECKQCGKMYSCPLTLRRHTSSVHHGIKYACNVCQRSFTSPNTLYHHKRGEHSEVKPFSCEQCKKPFKFYHSYKLHMLQHKGLRPHKCTQCDKTYLTSNHLKQHFQVVHSQAREYKCDTCGKCFGYLNSLKVHQKLHTGVRPYTCTICGKGFINLGALKAHEGRHVEGRHFKCDECGKFYKTEFLMKIHKRRHTTDVSRFMCDICGLTFMFKSNLEMHAAVHSDEKKYQCSTCGKAFKTYPTLYSHQQCHNPNNPFRCGVCGKMFKTKGRCYAHEKRHTEQKKHQCNFCQKFFSSKGDLSKHKRTVHINNKRFSCPICGKPSARSDNLRVHLTRVHGHDPKQVQTELMRVLEQKEEKPDYSPEESAPIPPPLSTTVDPDDHVPTTSSSHTGAVIGVDSLNPVGLHPQCSTSMDRMPDNMIVSDMQVMAPSHMMSGSFMPYMAPPPHQHAGLGDYGSMAPPDHAGSQYFHQVYNQHGQQYPQSGTNQHP